MLIIQGQNGVFRGGGGVWEGGLLGEGELGEGVLGRECLGEGVGGRGKPEETHWSENVTPIWE